MRKIITSEVVSCDRCRRTDVSYVEHIIDGEHYDFCPSCENIFKGIICGNDFEVSLNMNQSIRVCLGKDSADSYNKYWSGIKTLLVKAGEWKQMQLHAFLQECADAFKKSVGSLQNIATPFEIRMQFSDLRMVKDETKQ